LKAEERGYRMMEELSLAELRDITEGVAEFVKERDGRKG